MILLRIVMSSRIYLIGIIIPIDSNNILNLWNLFTIE